MSASREKKQRQGVTDHKVNQAQAAQTAYKKKVRLYSVIAVVLVVAVAALLVWNSGVFQRGKTAATLGSEKLTAAELGYYYYGTRYMYAAYGIIDTGKADDEQIYDSENNKSYRDFFLESALTSAQRTLAVYDKAIEAGYKLADVQEDLDAQIEAMKQSGASSGYSYKTTLIAMYGEYMTPAVYEKLVARELVANAYYEDVYNEKLDAVTLEEIQAYYDENADSLDTFEYSYLYFKADTVAETGEDGSALTDEEIAAEKERVMAAAKEQAEQALADYENGITLSSINEVREPSSYADHASVVGSSSISSLYRDELLKLGTDEAAVVEYENYGYYVVVYHGRHLDESATADIRQIYISAEVADDADEPTAEAWAAAEAKANEILAAYESGEKTAEAFGVIADANGMSNGGLVTGTTSANLSGDRGEWVFAEGRAAGDAAVIKYESGSYYGYYVICYQGENVPTWQSTSRSSLTSTAMTEWMDGLLTNYATELASGADSLGR